MYSIDCVIVNDMSSCVVKSREWKLSNQPLLSFTINQPIPHPYRFVCYSDERHSSINFCVGIHDSKKREEELGMVYCYSVGVSLVRIRNSSIGMFLMGTHKRIGCNSSILSSFYNNSLCEIQCVRLIKQFLPSYFTINPHNHSSSSSSIQQQTQTQSSNKKRKRSQ